jgi:regulatory protein
MQEKSFIPLDFDTALKKMEAFCAYQERSQYEVRGKLIQLGIRNEELEQIIIELIENNYLNESRFAHIYAKGKLRIKGWGKIKISQGLKLKQVSAPIIKKALQALDETEYLEKLREVIAKKERNTSEKVGYQRNYKVVQYALSRGFEQDLIFYVLKDSGL